MASARYLLTLARLEPERKRKLGVIATADELELVTLDDTNAALSWLERHDPRIVAFDPSIPKAEKVCQKVRAKRSLAAVPVIALAPQLDDLFVAKLYGMGADDVLPGGAWGSLVSRIRSIPTAESLRPPPARGRAVVADPDHGRCDVVARVLMSAGYDVRLALDARALQYYSQQKDIEVVVASSDLGSAVEFAKSSRKGPTPPIWIITAQRRELNELTEGAAGLDRVAVVGAYTPPENILFSINELASGQRNSGRLSSRVLYGTLVWFRPVGADEDEVGFSYNISRDGLYVRTLAPPEGDVVWLELRPPRAKGRARLEGQVVWRQRFGPGAMVSGPSGFGVKITSGLGDGAAGWCEGYETLAHTAAPGGFARVSRPEIDVTPGAGARESSPVVQITGVIDPTPSMDAASLADAAPRHTSSVPPPLPARKSGPSSAPPPASVPPAAAPPASVPPAAAPPASVPPGAMPSSPPGAMPSSPPGAMPSSIPPPLPVNRSRVPLLVVVALVIGGVAALFATGIVGLPGSSARGTPSATVAAPVTATAATAPAVPTVSIAPSASAAPSPSAAPPESAPPSASGAPSGGAASELPPVDLAGGDGSDLLANEGYIVGHFPGAGVLYLTGMVAGPVNQKLKVHCGLRFARVGVEPMSKWLSEGMTVDVKCQKITEITLSPPKKP